MHGVVNLLKPPGMSSHDAVACVRRALGEKRVGHTGTLDPAAAGVLPICVGQATRLVEYLQAGVKGYRTEMLFGHATDSGDLLGDVVAEQDSEGLTRLRLEEALSHFRGTITQVPPLHSALKINGQRLYDIARAGGTVDIPSRAVHISRLELLRFVPATCRTPARALLDVDCSGGTYIRSLVRDLALAAEQVATMSFLVRTRSGRFSLESGTTVEEIQMERLVPLQDLLREQVMWEVESDELSLEFFQGRQVSGAALKHEGMVSPMGGGPAMGLVRNVAQNLLALVQGDESSKSGSGGTWFRAEKVFDLR